MQQNIHYQADVLERFIPISLTRLINDLLSSNLLAAEQHAPLPSFVQTIRHYFTLNLINS